MDFVKTIIAIRVDSTASSSANTFTFPFTKSMLIKENSFVMSSIVTGTIDSPYCLSSTS